jgi:hypothetical protein
LKISGIEQAKRGRAVSEVLATIIVFSMVFTVALGAFVYVNQGTLSANQAQQVRGQGINQASQEKLSIKVGLSHVPDPWGQTGDLWLRVSNTGTVSVTLIDVFITSTATDKIVKSAVSGSQYLSSYVQASKGDLNYSLPTTILPGISSNQMAGCGSKVGCDIAVSKTSYAFGGTPVVISVVTSSGNVFSSLYPSPPTGSVTSTSSTTITTSTSTLNTANPGGSVLVVQMVATPPQTFTCAHCVNDTVTVFNYGNSTVTGISLSPSIPQVEATGKVTVAPTGSCVLQGGINTLPAYSGSGSPPSITYRCTYSANPNGFGGFVSFMGSATGTYRGLAVTSGVATSNTIQVGGPLNVLNQGPFSANYFFFKVSYCYQKTGSFFAATVGCTGLTPSPLTVANLPNANLQNASSDYYDAYYVQVTNNFNTTLPLLHYSFFQTDPTKGGESDFYLVGVNNTAFRTNKAYFPSYNTAGSGDPTLTGYPTDCGTVNGNNVPTDSNCIYIKPGQNVTLTFAACSAGSTNWDWGGVAYGRTFDNPFACFPQSPPNYFTPESTYLSIILSFVYNGQVLNQNIPFEGETISGGVNNGGLSCNEGKYCGDVYFTEYSGLPGACQGHSCQASGGYGAMGYFAFTYDSVAHTLTIPAPVFVVPSNPGFPHGADGIAFNPQDHMIMVGANDGTDTLQEVNPTTGAVSMYSTSVGSGQVEPYNVHVQSDGTRVWVDGDGIPGFASLPLTPTPGAVTSRPITGDDSQVNALMFVPGNSIYAYYTSECNTNNVNCNTGSRFGGVQGHVGVINLQTGVTTCFKTAGTCTLFQGVHGGVYDPYTGNLMVFGSNMINEITTSGVLVAHEVVGTLTDLSTGNPTNLATNTFDQGALDGFGHLFIAWNGGGVYFEDYAATGVIGSSNTHFYTSDGGAFQTMDDLAPIIGPGSSA